MRKNTSLHVITDDIYENILVTINVNFFSEKYSTIGESNYLKK